MDKEWTTRIFNERYKNKRKMKNNLWVRIYINNRCLRDFFGKFIQFYSSKYRIKCGFRKLKSGVAIV